MEFLTFESTHYYYIINLSVFLREFFWVFFHIVPPDEIMGRGCSFENCSFEFSSNIGQRMDWGPQGLTFSPFYCFPNLT
jgi:hypothetical protein